MANTIDNKLLVDKVIENFEAYAGPTIGFSKEFVLDYSDKYIDAAYLTQGVQIPVTTSVGNVNVDPATFGNNNRTVAAVSVPVHLYSVDWTETIYEGQVPGENSLAQAVESMAEKIGSVILSQFVTGSGFTTASVNLSGADSDEKINTMFKNIYAVTSKAGPKFLVANPELFSKGLPVNLNSFNPLEGNGFRGFKGCYESSILPTGDKAIGVVCGRKALALINVLPDFRNVDGLESTPVVIDSLGGLRVLLNKWSDKSSRSTKWSLDVALGVAPFDKNDAKILVQK